MVYSSYLGDRANGRPSSRSSSRSRDSPEGPAPMVSSSDLGDRPQWSPEFPILLTTPRFPRGTGTNGLLVRSGRPAPMVARSPDPPHDPEIPPRDRHPWFPRHRSPWVHLQVSFATTLGPIAAFGSWMGLAWSFLEFLGVTPRKLQALLVLISRPQILGQSSGSWLRLWPVPQICYWEDASLREVKRVRPARCVGTASRHS